MAVTPEQVRVGLFKAALREYFFNSEDVQATYWVPDEEATKNISKDADSLAIAKGARDYAFEAFFRRLATGPVLRADGSIYGNESINEIAKDFMDGKDVIFKGVGNDNFVKIKGNKASLTTDEVGENRASYRKNGINDIRKRLSDANAVSYEKYEPVNQIPELQGETSPEKPTGGSVWNSIVKFFTGRPSARWAPYERHLKQETVSAAMRQADLVKEQNNELNQNRVKQQFKAATIDRHKEVAEATHRRYDPDADRGLEVDVDQILGNIMPGYHYDPATKKIVVGSVKKTEAKPEVKAEPQERKPEAKPEVKAEPQEKKTEVREEKPEAAKEEPASEGKIIDLDEEEEEGKIIDLDEEEEEIGKEPEVKKTEAKAPEGVKNSEPEVKQPAEKEKKENAPFSEGNRKVMYSIMGRVNKSFRFGEKGTKDAIADLTENGQKLFSFDRRLCMSVLKLGAMVDPNTKYDKPATREELAEELANVYLIGELVGEINKGNTRTEKGENVFGVIHKDLEAHSDRFKLRNEIKETLLKTEVADKIWNDPSVLNTTLFTQKEDGLARFTAGVRGKTEGLLERTAEANRQKNMGVEKPRTEGSSLGY